MVYVPLLKLRTIEKKVLEIVGECLSEQIIPLIEIVEDLYPTLYEMDSETGAIVSELRKDKSGKTKRFKKTRKPNSDEYNTLEQISEMMRGNKVFVDYFRFHQDEYRGANINYSKVTLSLKLRKDEYYKERLKEILSYDNMIPVISIKPHYVFPKMELTELIHQLKANQHAVALRIHVSMLEQYQDICENELEEMDYIMADVRQDPVDSHVMELTELAAWDCQATKIVLNSPRDRKIATTEFEEEGITELIDNSARELCLTFGLSGYGDYVSYSDKLPQGQQGQGESGSALAFMYRYDVNGFEVFRNAEEKGLKGFLYVYEKVMEAEERLNPDGDCFGYGEIRKARGYKDWKLWIRVGMVRYIHQMYKYME